MTSVELAKNFLKEKDSRWISVKQSRWLRDVLGKEMKEYIPDNRAVSFGEFSLNKCAPNGACILRKEIIKPGEPRLRMEFAVEVTDVFAFQKALLAVMNAGLKPVQDFHMDLSVFSFYPHNEEIKEKMMQIIS